MVKLSDLMVATGKGIWPPSRPASVSDLVEALIAEGAVDYEAAQDILNEILNYLFADSPPIDAARIVNAALGIGKEAG